MTRAAAGDYAGWTVPILAHFVEQRANAEAAVARRALDECERRLDRLASLRETIDAAAARSISRAEYENEMRGLRGHLEGQINPLREAVAAHDKPNYVVLGGFITTMFAMISTAWFLIGMQISVANTPLALAMEQIKTTQTGFRNELNSIEERLHGAETALAAAGAFEVESKADRERLNEALRLLRAGQEAEIAARLASDAQADRQMAQLQAQICAGEVTRNLMNAAILQRLALTARVPVWLEYFPATCQPQR